MNFIFDMDGTIVDSRRAVREAYKLAGINMPPEAWGNPWHEWGVTPEQHDEKVRIYPAMLRQYGRRLPAADLLVITQGIVLTSASYEATEAVRSLLKIHFEVMGVSLTQQNKLYLLKNYHDNVGPFIYVDDDVNFGRRVAEEIPKSYFLNVASEEGVFNLWRKKEGSYGAVVQRWVHAGWTDRPFISSGEEQ